MILVDSPTSLRLIPNVPLQFYASEALYMANYYCQEKLHAEPANSPNSAGLETHIYASHLCQWEGSASVRLL